MTTTLGVRDLKREAPKLVKRAARGETFVITRYGRPLAALVPASDSVVGHGVTGPEMAWQAERRAFERLPISTVRRYRGKYVAIFRGAIVGAAADPDDLFERTWKKLDGAVFFLGRVGAEPAIVDMPGMEVR